jgi:hypothetical protein
VIETKYYTTWYSRIKNQFSKQRKEERESYNRDAEEVNKKIKQLIDTFPLDEVISIEDIDINSAVNSLALKHAFNPSIRIWTSSLWKQEWIDSNEFVIDGKRYDELTAKDDRRANKSKKRKRAHELSNEKNTIARAKSTNCKQKRGKRAQSVSKNDRQQHDKHDDDDDGNNAGEDDEVDEGDHDDQDDDDQDDDDQEENDGKANDGVDSGPSNKEESTKQSRDTGDNDGHDDDFDHSDSQSHDDSDDESYIPSQFSQTQLDNDAHGQDESICMDDDVAANAVHVAAPVPDPVQIAGEYPSLWHKLIAQFATCFVKPSLYNAQEKLFNEYKDKLMASGTTEDFPYHRFVKDYTSSKQSTQEGRNYILYHDKQTPCSHLPHLLCQCTRIRLVIDDPGVGTAEASSKKNQPTNIRFFHAIGRDETDQYPSLILSNSEYINLGFNCDTCVTLPPCITYTPTKDRHSETEAVVLLLHPKSPEGQLNNCDAVDATHNVKLVHNTSVTSDKLQETEVDGVSKLVIPKDVVRLKHIKSTSWNSPAPFTNDEELILLLDAKSDADRQKQAAKFCGLCALPLSDKPTCCLVGLLLESDWHACEANNNCLSKLSHTFSQIQLIEHVAYHKSCGEEFRQATRNKPEFQQWWSSQQEYLISLVSQNSHWMINQLHHMGIDAKQDELSAMKWIKFVKSIAVGASNWEEDNSSSVYVNENLRIWSDVEIYNKFKSDIECMVLRSQEPEPDAEEESASDSSKVSSDNLKQWENRLKRIDKCLTESQQGQDTFQSHVTTESGSRRSRKDPDKQSALGMQGNSSSADNISVYIPDAKANGNCFFYSLHAIFRNHNSSMNRKQTTSSSSITLAQPLIYKHVFTGKSLQCSELTTTSTSSNNPPNSDVIGRTIEIPITNILSAVMAVWLHLSCVDNNTNQSAGFGNLGPLFLRADYISFNESDDSPEDMRQLLLHYGVLPVLHARMLDIYNRVQTPKDGLTLYAGVFEAAQIVNLFEKNALRIVFIHGEGYSDLEERIIKQRHASRIVIDSATISLMNEISAGAVSQRIAELKGPALSEYIVVQRYSDEYQQAARSWITQNEMIDSRMSAKFECFIQHRSTKAKPFIVDETYDMLDQSLFSSFNHFDPILFATQPPLTTPYVFSHCSQKLSGMLYSAADDAKHRERLTLMRSYASSAAKAHARYCYIRDHLKQKEHEIQSEILFDAASKQPHNKSDVESKVALHRRQQQYQTLIANLCKDKLRQTILYSEFYVTALQQHIRAMKDKHIREKKGSGVWRLLETTHTDAIVTTHVIENSATKTKYLCKALKSGTPHCRKLTASSVINTIHKVQGEIPPKIFQHVESSMLLSAVKRSELQWLTSSHGGQQHQQSSAETNGLDFYYFACSNTYSVYDLVHKLSIIDKPISNAHPQGTMYDCESVKHDLCSQVAQIAAAFMQHFPAIYHCNMSPNTFFIKLKKSTCCPTESTKSSMSTPKPSIANILDNDIAKDLQSVIVTENDPVTRREKLQSCLAGDVRLAGFEHMVVFDNNGADEGSKSFNSFLCQLKSLVTGNISDNGLFSPPIDSSFIITSETELMQWICATNIFQVAATIIFIIVGHEAYSEAFSKDINVESKTVSNMKVLCKRLLALHGFYKPTFLLVLGEQKCEALKYMIAAGKSLQETYDTRKVGMKSFMSSNPLDSDYGQLQPLDISQLASPLRAADSALPLNENTSASATSSVSSSSSSSKHEKASQAKKSLAKAAAFVN